jgi:predicted metal-dependent hydrolase
MSITVRYPDFKFESASPHWAKDIAFAHQWNGTSIIPAYVEPYLIKVFESALPLIQDEQLKQDMNLFMNQERQHCFFHLKYNRMLREHYPKLREYEDRLKNELNDFLKNKPMRFHLAYAEGFESSFGVLNARIWLDDLAEYREGADPETLALWDWHMAEEYEHREVCFQAYMSLFGRGFVNRIVNGYFYRLYGAYFAMKHLGAFTARCMYHMLNADCEKMPPEQAEAVRAQAKALGKKIKKLMNRRMWVLVSPFYNPKTKPEPRGFRAAVARVVENGIYAKKTPAT